MSPRVRSSLIYFVYFGAAGAFSPYLNLHYQNLGISNQDIGFLIAALTLMNVLASPIWSAIADAFNLHRYLLPISLFGAIVPIFFLIGATDFVGLLISILVYGFFIGPAVPLVDNAVLSLLGDDRDSYGRLRLWGAPGFGIMAWLAGILSEQYGMTINFIIFIVMMLVCGLLTLNLPAPQIKMPGSYLRNLKLLARNWVWMAFLCAVLMGGITSSMFHNYYVLHVDHLGASESIYGLSVAIAGLSEIPVFYFSVQFIRRFSARGVLIIGFAAFMIRSFLAYFITDPQLIILPQLFHGLSFSAVWLASVVYISQLVPAGLGATAQSSLGLVMFSLSGLFGGLVGSRIYDAYGSGMLYFIGGCTALIGMLIMLGIDIYSRRTTTATIAMPAAD